MTPTTIAIAILALAAVGVVVLVVRSARGKRGRLEDVPPGMRPAYSDDQLERSVLERYMAWGLVLTVFFALFLPGYWFLESRRLQGATEGFFTSSVARGELLYTENCARCHGSEGGGGAAESPYDPEDSWPAPNLTNIAARYEENPNIEDLHDYIFTTIARGRPGTPMPVWSAAYGGPLTDQQIEEITDWILANQVDETEQATSASNQSGAELYAQNCARCHGDEGKGVVGPSLVGVFERHNDNTVLAILRNGIYLGTGVSMPPWQNGYFYPEAHYNDEALTKIVAYLKELQPAQLPEDAGQYQTPGVGAAGEGGNGNGDSDGDGGDDDGGGDA